MITPFDKDCITVAEGGSTGNDPRDYAALAALMSEMIDDHETSKPEFVRLWQRMEDVKNRHGGTPPR